MKAHDIAIIVGGGLLALGCTLSLSLAFAMSAWHGAVASAVVGLPVMAIGLLHKYAP